MINEAGWIYAENLLHCLTLVAGEAAVNFDEDDWIAIEAGLEGTSDTADRWFDYKLATSNYQVDLQLSKDDGDDSTGITHVRFKGLPDEVIAARVSTVLSICSQHRFATAATF